MIYWHGVGGCWLVGRKESILFWTVYTSLPAGKGRMDLFTIFCDPNKRTQETSSRFVL